MECFIIPVMLVTLFIMLIVLARNGEKKDWNKGISPYTNKPWRLFDVDSQGIRGYTDSLGNTIWITYNVDK